MKTATASTPLRSRLVLLVLLSAGALAGCTNTLIVQGEFPQPLVAEMPLTAGVYYPDEFRQYRYEEDSKDRSRWIIDTGNAQTSLFSTVLPGMFENVVEVDSLPPWDQLPANVDLVVAPRVEEFQYTLPRETNVKVFEIWIKYDVQVFNPQGDLIADWIVTAYGKTPTGFMRSNTAALNEAVLVALRDAGANLALNFARVPEVRAWLEQR